MNKIATLKKIKVEGDMFLFIVFSLVEYFPYKRLELKPETPLSFLYFHPQPSDPTRPNMKTLFELDTRLETSCRACFFLPLFSVTSVIC